MRRYVVLCFVYCGVRLESMSNHHGVGILIHGRPGS